jgi:hypothetical protein
MSIPASGQTRYEAWKARPMKTSKKIERAKPAGASHASRERQCARMSRIVAGSQRRKAMRKKGYASLRPSIAPMRRSKAARP